MAGFFVKKNHALKQIHNKIKFSQFIAIVLSL
jgi:hypothetical protein